MQISEIWDLCTKNSTLRGHKLAKQIQTFKAGYHFRVMVSCPVNVEGNKCPGRALFEEVMGGPSDAAPYLHELDLIRCNTPHYIQCPVYQALPPERRKVMEMLCELDRRIGVRRSGVPGNDVQERLQEMDARIRERRGA